MLEVEVSKMKFDMGVSSVVAKTLKAAGDVGCRLDTDLLTATMRERALYCESL